MNDPEARAPQVFVSYSWDDEEHQEWVHAFATRLRADGVDAHLDQWEARFGDPLPEFMERAVRENDFVLVVCTPKYKERSDGRVGGVGFEGDIMTAEVLSQRNHRKFVPVLRRGGWSSAFPSWLSGKKGADLRGDPYREEQYARLLAALHGQAPGVPPLGPRPARAAEPVDHNRGVLGDFDYASSGAASEGTDPAELEGARRQLKALPLKDLAPRGGLPPRSVMRLRPNRNFVGRHEDL
jgi:hypothetical protein